MNGLHGIGFVLGFDRIWDLDLDWILKALITSKKIYSSLHACTSTIPAVNINSIQKTNLNNSSNACKTVRQSIKRDEKGTKKENLS